MLKSLLKKEKIIVAPGTYDALSASIAKQAGFKTLYMTGFGVSGALLAKPDIGLISASEMIARLKSVVMRIMSWTNFGRVMKSTINRSMPPLMRHVS